MARSIIYSFATGVFLIAASKPVHTQTVGPTIRTDERPSATFRHVPAQNAILVVGAIDSSFDTDLLTALEKYPNSKLLIIHSEGGLRARAIRASEILNDQRVAVRVFGSCASACALLWASSNAREMSSGSRIGLHRNRVAGFLPNFIEDLIARGNDDEDDVVLRRAGFSDRLLSLRDRTPASDVTWIPSDVLAREGVKFRLVRAGSTGSLKPFQGQNRRETPIN